MEIFIILLITVPIFYIYGLVSFIRTVTKNNRVEPINESLQIQIIKELSVRAAESPNKTIAELLEDYQKRAGFNPAEIKSEGLFMGEEPNKPVLQERRNVSKENFFDTWYSTNSINLLLYIGAFFIIAAAAIFVSFQWETIPGVIKALLLTLVNVAFLGCGLWFYSIPKIKNAGTTFIAIAAILIPVIGSAWYTFVLAGAGIPVGIAWLITSAIALTFYIYLALFMKTSFYAYASTIGTFSLMFSLVKSFELAQDFYLLASIIVCFILLAVSYQMKKIYKLAGTTFSVPTELSSQVAMPITLVYGLIMAVSENKLFTFEGTLSCFLAGLFYFIGYKLTKSIGKLAFSQVLLLIALFLFCQWQDFSSVLQYYTLSICALGYALLGYYYHILKKNEESDVSLVISTVTAIIVFSSSWQLNESAINMAILSLFPIAISLATSWIKKNPYPLLISSSFFAIFLYILYMNVFKYSDYPEYLGLLYLIQGVARYMLTFALSKKKEVQQVGYLTIASYCTLAIVLTISHHWLLLLCTMVIAFLFFATSIVNKTMGVSMGGVVFLFFSLLLFLSQIHTEYVLYPIVIGIFSYILFLAGTISPPHMMQELRMSALATSTLSSMFFFFNSQSGFTTQEAVNRNALIGAYGTTILYSWDYMLYKIKNFGYVTSVVGLLTLLWQIQYLGYTDTLMYTTPVGLYFMAVAYTRKLKEDRENEKILNIVALFFLLIPPFFLSFGDHAVKYSLILGLEGILMVGFGISLTNVLFRLAGVGAIILAVLPQTYTYVLSLPRWVLVGIMGIAFLAFAIFLLLKRKDES